MFLLYAKLRAIEVCWNQVTHHLLLHDIKLFWKTNGGLVLVYLPHLVNIFWIKIFLCLYSINRPNFIVRLFLFREILDIVCIIIVCHLGCDVINFRINSIFLIKLFFLRNLENEKSFYDEITSRAFIDANKAIFFGR